MFCPQYVYSTLSPTAALVTLGVVKNVNVTSGGNPGPSQAGFGDVVAQLDHRSATASIVTVLVTATIRPPALRRPASPSPSLNGGTGFGSNATAAEAGDLHRRGRHCWSHLPLHFV